MRLLILAAAIQLANRNTGQTEYGDAVWDKTVAQVVVDGGSLVDVRNPIYAARTALKGEGRFGGECPRFTTNQEFSCSTTPFALNSDFTIEGHFLFEDLTRSNQYLVDLGANGFILRLYDNQIAVHTGGATVILGSGLMPVTDKWYHIAVTRQGPLLKLFIDGVMFSQAIYTSNLGYATYSLGNYGGGGNYSITGRIDQFRVVQSALYTENFTPPSAPFSIGTVEPDFDPYFDKVKLLISNSAAGSMVDSIGARTITPVNGALISTIDTKLGDSSMDVAAAGSYFQVEGDVNPFNFSSDSWCVEAYVKPDSRVIGYVNIVARTNGTQHGGWSLCLSSGRPALRFSLSGTSWTVLIAPTSGAELIIGKWSHIAACRVGGVFMLFISGKLVASVGTTGALASNSIPVTIGASSNGAEKFIGNIAAVRVTRGDLRYWSEFTPRMNTPYALNGNIVPSDRDPYWPKVQALIEYIDDVGAGPDAFSIVLRRASVALDNTRQLFGKDTVTMPTGANGGFNYSNGSKTMLGNVDSTVEGWVNTDYVGTVILPIIGQHHATGIGAWLMGVVNGKAAFSIRNGVYLESAAIVNDGQWHHVAVAIRSQVVYLYVDGVLQGSGAWGTIPSYNGNVQVGYNIVTETAAGYRLNLSRLRITQGQARYQANFTPDANTVQLISLAA